MMLHFDSLHGVHSDENVKTLLGSWLRSRWQASVTAKEEAEREAAGSSDEEGSETAEDDGESSGAEGGAADKGEGSRMGEDGVKDGGKRGEGGEGADSKGRAREGKEGRSKGARKRLRALNSQHEELLGRIQVYKTNVTQQSGFVNCGVFVLMFAEELLSRVPDGLNGVLRRMWKEEAERRRAGREWQQGKDKKAGEGEGEEWTAWFADEAAQGRRREIVRVLKGLGENARGRAEGASDWGIATNVTSVASAAGTNEVEGTVYVETGGGEYCVRWKAEEAGETAEGVMGEDAEGEEGGSEPEDLVVAAEVTCFWGSAESSAAVDGFVAELNAIWEEAKVVIAKVEELEADEAGAGGRFVARQRPPATPWREMALGDGRAHRCRRRPRRTAASEMIDELLAFCRRQRGLETDLSHLNGSDSEHGSECEYHTDEEQRAAEIFSRGLDLGSGSGGHGGDSGAHANGERAAGVTEGGAAAEATVTTPTTAEAAPPPATAPPAPNPKEEEREHRGQDRPEVARATDVEEGTKVWAETFIETKDGLLTRQRKWLRDQYGSTEPRGPRGAEWEEVERRRGQGQLPGPRRVVLYFTFNSFY